MKMYMPYRSEFEIERKKLERALMDRLYASKPDMLHKLAIIADQDYSPEDGTPEERRPDCDAKVTVRKIYTNVGHVFHVILEGAFMEVEVEEDEDGFTEITEYYNSDWNELTTDEDTIELLKREFPFLENEI